MAQKLIYHGLVSRHAPLAIDLEIMRQTGFQGLEVSGAKMRAALEGGITEAELAAWLAPVDVPGLGFLLDIERQGEDHAALLQDARALFRLAGIAGARGVQVLTGPVQVQAVQAFASGGSSGLYEGVLRLPRDEQVQITARNLAELADIAAEDGLLLYLEALAWAPLNRLAAQVEVIRRANRPNLRLAVDFWHCYASGDRPEDVAALPGDLIYGVHVCDSLAFAGGIPDESVLRDVPTGQGALVLQDWVDAVKSTGYQGWWSCELFCRRQQQDNSFVVARELHGLMAGLIGTGGGG
ncbi:sugar phosphate isomerase/epimerase family protein [Tabrizicola oligotrophica]|uniref:Sugar phosphate isomerase/epimerase n=1 Tax=Tabrizicola oligotrophica TaxID=2710650 RepID=A0A6M0QXA0_9RHOB|nr:sugar phosphate isomerase/epimerase family protein [Tabrizicola oligotrophica]NEY92079.1 sugar phosphate isomerase/epimerase [Tabrizicola oligotrophica]